MKALSVRQPWAWAILFAGKRIENRTRSTNFRGEFLLHASKSCGRYEYLEAVQWMVVHRFVRHELFRRPGDQGLPLLPALDELARGGIVGRATLVDVVPPANAAGARAEWHNPGSFGYVLDDVHELPFEQLDGCLGFFNVDRARVTVRRTG